MVKFALILIAVFIFTCVVGLIDEQLHKRKAKQRNALYKQLKRVQRKAIQVQKYAEFVAIAESVNK